MGRRLTYSELGCPKHGAKYLFIDKGGICYCAYPTPDERFSKCFYHPGGKPNDNLPKEKNSVKPDVMKSLVSEWGRRRLHVAKIREKRHSVSKPTPV